MVFTYTYFGNYWHEDFVEKRIDNIQEWQTYFCEKPKMEDLRNAN
jgi:hypothetical protein